jgi:AraC-like DNA-binding protein
VRWSDVDVTVPRPHLRQPGVSMAGFRQRAPGFWDVAMVAHPAVSLLVDLSEGTGAVYETPAGTRQGSVAAGLLPGPVRATGWATVECLQIRLAPAVAAAVLGPAAELTGQIVPLGEVWRGAEGRLRGARSWEERFTIAIGLLDERGRTDPEVAHVWGRTVAGRGRPRVEDLAGEVGWSRKRLWSRFRAQVGITPKHAARLVRFDHAAHLLAAGRAPADVAAVSGYADQSHLHRETREFAGLTPAAVAAAPWLAIDPTAWPGGVTATCVGGSGSRRPR